MSDSPEPLRVPVAWRTPGCPPAEVELPYDHDATVEHYRAQPLRWIIGHLPPLPFGEERGVWTTEKLDATPESPR